MSSKAGPLANPPLPDQDTPGAFPPDAPDNDAEAGLSSDLVSLSRAVRARKAEYTRQREVRVKIGSWNVASLTGTEKDITNWFVDSKWQYATEQPENENHKSSDANNSGANGEGKSTDSTLGNDDTSAGVEEEVGIYVLGLQEIVDVSSASEALRPYVDPGPSKRWKQAVTDALPAGYQLIAEQQLVGLLVLIYAAPSIAPTVSSVSCTSVGTGLMGYMGNKGAVAVRLVLGEMSRLVFVNCHLAAGADKGSLERRNWDASQILSRTRFEPVKDSDGVEQGSNYIGDEDFAFWFGDLNYRLNDIPGDDVRRLLHLHTGDTLETYSLPKKPMNDADEVFAVSTPESESNDPTPRPTTPSTSSETETHISGSLSPSDTLCDDGIETLPDPGSLQTTLSSLLPHDQLHEQQRKGRALHEGWREGQISFLPTYKYDIGSFGKFDSSEKQRGPSWCDRILYRSRQDRDEYERLRDEAAEAKRRDEEMKARGLDKAAEDDNVLFDYDPDVDGTNEVGDYDENEDVGDEPNTTEEQDTPGNAIVLGHYVSHQDILSSDHKPLDAVFTLKYDAVIPELKAKIHQEVARELDKAENEARPGITVVVDHHVNDSSDSEDNKTSEDPSAVDFGRVRYDVPVSRSLTIANTGGVSATFGFRERSAAGGQASVVSPPWVSLQVLKTDEENENTPIDTRKEFTLNPGETIAVVLTACISDLAFVRKLNDGVMKVEDILVLRVTNGRDYFIPIHGKWLPSCFGRSLEELTRMPEGGARELDPQASRDDQNKGEAVRLSAPRELFRLTEAVSDLTERSIAEWSMTKEGDENETPPWMCEPHCVGWPFKAETWMLKSSSRRSELLASVRDVLDTGGSFSSAFDPEISSLHRLEVLSETLLEFLWSIRDGIITKSLWQDMESQILAREKSKKAPLSNEESQAWILEVLSPSPAHSVSFTFLTFMLVRIANEVAPVISLPSPTSTPKSPPTAASGSSGPTEVLTENIPPSTPLPSRPTSLISAGSLRRKTRTQTSSISHESTPTNNPSALRRQSVDRAFATIFADVIFSNEITPPSKEKERRAREERKKAILEPFLKVSGTGRR
ncbi:hypothetical protein FQN54_007677 [Arachnomyces sp. PD_36]|nr:hypothetical protein FQN54_007677 [Arachnomyces sp. PD_36]